MDDTVTEQHYYRIQNMVGEGTETGAGGGWARDMGAVVDKPGGGVLCATQPAPGAAAGGRADRGPSSAAAWRWTAAEGADTGGAFDWPQEVILDTRSSASDTCAPERATLPKQRDNAEPDATGQHPKKPTTAHDVPRQMRSETPAGHILCSDRKGRGRQTRCRSNGTLAGAPRARNDPGRIAHQRLF